MKKQKLFLFLLLLLGNMILYAQCNVNAGGNQTICGTTYTLQGTSSGGTNGTPTWSIVSKPAGAPDPVFSNANSLTPTVTEMTFPGDYVFRITQPCASLPDVTSQVTITAPGANAGFTAGPDITNVNATTGTVTLNGVVPNGYTASWSAYNIFRWDRSSIKTDQNSQFSSTTSATTTFSLINKANHDVDPAYVVTLRITSINNPNCWYEDTAIIRFIPNPQILPVVSTSKCVSNGTTHFISLQSTSPKFSKGYATSPGSSGNFGTTITMNVSSQPAGGNIAFWQMYDNSIDFTGVNAVGIYKFTLTITNVSGTYTTPEITYNYTGIQSREVSFLVPARPEQMMIYQSGSSGGEVHCNFAGTTTPVTVLFTLNSSDPLTNTTTVSNSGTTPPGGVPSLSGVSGSGISANRSFTVTPPSGGWRVGTYIIRVVTGNGSCTNSQSYYIHISDGNRPAVTIPNTTICYPGSGIVSATVPLPAAYKGVVNSSYFQDFDGRYRLTLVSKPAGAADPTFEPYNSTSFTNLSTTISNLNMQGEYVFKIKADTYTTGVGAFLDKEYACSGTSLESTFSVFVSAQVGANAGSDQNVSGNTTALNGNNPGIATGAWTLISKPSNATDPVIATPSAYNSNVTGFDTTGVYTFRWTVTTGTCISASDVNINITIVPQNYCVRGCNGNAYVNSTDPNTIEYDNLISTFHASLAKEKDGTFKVWGQVSGSNAGDLYKPTVIAPSSIANENFNYTGTPLKVASGSISNAGHQFALLTTDGLYAWGTNNTLISSSIKSTNTFGKITIDSKADGLPAGVSPTDVKMMFGSYRTLAIVTCTGDAWVLSAHGSKNGDGTTQNSGTPNTNTIWHRVKTSATENLTGVVAMRGTPNALFALTSLGNLYTWGTGTYINNGAAENRIYATPVTKPAGTTPKMIGMTQGGATANMPTSQTYYLLATDGKLYAMGNNTNRQLGNGSTTESDAWIEVTATSGANTLGGNIVWISPNEHSEYENSASINILTNTNKQWGWGSNSGNMLGQQNAGIYFDPIFMPGNSVGGTPDEISDGLSLTDEVVAVETGGHTTVNVKKCSQFFGYVGHKTNGSMGNGNNSTGNPYRFSYATSILIVCGTDVGPRVQDVKICENTTTNLNDVVLEGNLDEIEWHATNDVTSPILTNVTAVGPGTYYAFFSVASGKCRLVGSIVTVSNYQATDPEYGSCPVPYCYKPGVINPLTALPTKAGITALSRAGATDADIWPMTRKGGWLALESKTKGFVPNKVLFSGGNPVGIAPANFVEGMMVYDDTNKCMKMYTLKEGDTSSAWHCISTQTCPD